MDASRWRWYGVVAVALVATVAAVALAIARPSTLDTVATPPDGLTQGGRARQVILMIGDGMGDSEITIARNYAKGAAGRLALDTLPLTGAYTTYSVQKAEPSKPDYVTDSAASATGWATGHKTYNGAISVTPDGKAVPTILELAQRAGFRTGDVTTAELTDATPAVLAAHVVDRGCQGPADLAGCPNSRSIAEQLVEHGVDVLLGGGRARFEQTITTGRTVLQQATAAGYAVVTDQAGLAATSQGQKVLGLFGPSTMDVEWTGPIAAPYPANTTPVACTPSNGDRPATQPHLSELTTKALELLENGFFLQVEGASIDKQDHAANPCGQIGETIEFDRAVRVVLDYAAAHPDTLVVVTGDHGHTSQIIEYPQTAARHSPGAIATLLTVDGAPMVVNYATVAGAPANNQDHTGTQIRVAAKGPQAFRILGVTDQTDLFTMFSAALGVER